MKKIMLAVLAIGFATSAFAQPRHDRGGCRVWKTRHHHRVCVRR